MITRLIGQAIVVIYLLGYWYYLISTLYLAWPRLSWIERGTFAMVQAMVSGLWPLWLWLGYRPFMA